jgi:hypothetical protein
MYWKGTMRLAATTDSFAKVLTGAFSNGFSEIIKEDTDSIFWGDPGSAWDVLGKPTGYERTLVTGSLQDAGSQGSDVVVLYPHRIMQKFRVMNGEKVIKTFEEYAFPRPPYSVEQIPPPGQQHVDAPGGASAPQHSFPN